MKSHHWFRLASVAFACMVWTSNAHASFLQTIGWLNKLKANAQEASAYGRAASKQNATIADNLLIPIENRTITDGASASASYGAAARASFGSLGAYAYGAATVADGNYAMGGGSGEAYFEDGFIIDNPTHSGAVTLNFQIAAHCVRTLTGTGYGSWYSQLIIRDWRGNYLYDDFVSQNDGEMAYKNASLTLEAGMPYTITGKLVTNASSATNADDKYTGTAEVDAWNTANYFAWTNDPSATLKTDSGATYALPTPEPSSLALLSGLSLIALRRPSRKRA